MSIFNLSHPIIFGSHWHEDSKEEDELIFMGIIVKMSLEAFIFHSIVRVDWFLSLDAASMPKQIDK